MRHFTEADHDYFYGRDLEVRELSDRVRRAPLTVLYGVSGYGKSSLIGAGLIPILRTAGYPIVLLRRCYDDLASRPLQGDVIAACASEIPGCTRPEAPEALTLWEFFHDRSQPWFRRALAEEEADSGASPDAWPVLILDQFEEIFVKGEDRDTKNPKEDALARESARAFLTELADLVENRPPAALRERLQSGAPDERRALARRFDFQARPVHVAVAVRDDFLARLERWRRVMPSLMEHRVELRLLSGPQAYKAAYEPGTKRAGQPPIIPADVATNIVRAAAGAAKDVPIEEIDAVPPILSLLCERLNDRSPCRFGAAAEHHRRRFLDRRNRTNPRPILRRQAAPASQRPPLLPRGRACLRFGFPGECHASTPRWRACAAASPTQANISAGLSTIACSSSKSAAASRASNLPTTRSPNSPSTAARNARSVPADSRPSSGSPGHSPSPAFPSGL